MTVREATRRSRVGSIAFVTLLVGLACIRLVGLGDRGLWLDESFSALVARRRLADLVAWLRLDSGPPLYYWLLGRQITLGGTSEWSLRLPSALAGIATPLVLYAFARSRWPAALAARRGAAIVTAVLPLLVLHAQDARYYALLPLVGIGSAWTLSAFLVRPALATGAAHALVTVIGLYLHNYGLLLLPAAMAFALVERRPARTLGALAVVQAIAVTAYAPWVPVLVDQLRFGATSWLSARWEPSLLLATANALVPGSPLPAYVPMPPGIVPGGVAIALLAVIVGTAVVGIRRRPGDRSIVALAAFAVTPLAIAAGVSLAGRPIYAAARADLIVLPLLVLALSLAVVRTRRALAIALLAIVVALSAIQLARYAGSDVKSSDRTLAEGLVRNAHDADLVITSGLTLAPLEHYARERGAGLRFVPFPVEMRDHPGSLPRSRLRDPDALVAAFVAELGGAVQDIGRPARAIVFVTDDPFGTLLGRTLDAVGVTRSPTPVASGRLAVLGTPVDVYRCEVPMPAPASEGGP